MEFAIWLIVGLIVGGGIGALATWWISRARGGAVSVMQLKQENDRFRNEVTEHFVETARLINQMTDSYKQVFDHLSSGAEKLVDDKSLAERLPPASGREVRLSQFGAPASRGPESSGSDQGGAAQRTGKAESKPQDETQDKTQDNARDNSRDKRDPLKGRPGGQATDTTRQNGDAAARSDAGKRADADRDGSSPGSGQSAKGSRASD